MPDSSSRKAYGHSGGREAISRLRAARGGPVLFVQSGGCCAGSLLDVATGPPEGFSLAAGDNLHFITRVPTTRSTTTEWSTP